MKRGLPVLPVSPVMQKRQHSSMFTAKTPLMSIDDFKRECEPSHGSYTSSIVVAKSKTKLILS